MLTPTSLVLVCLLPSPRDLEIARLLGWYRIPFRTAPKVVAVDYLAFYQPGSFGDQSGRIEWIAAVRGHELTTRGELLHDETDHPRAGEEYFKIQLGPLEPLTHPIVAEKWKRITFLYTTGEYLLRAQTLNDLVVESEERQFLWQSLRERAGSGQAYQAGLPEMDIPPDLLVALLGIKGGSGPYDLGMTLRSINKGIAENIRVGNRSDRTGIFKSPVTGPIRVTTLGLEGDFIGNQKHHGGPDQAIYIYGEPDYEWWGCKLGRKLPPGTFGENMTIASLESASFCIGDRLETSQVTLEVTAPRIPCATLAARMGKTDFIADFREAEQPGLYCRVLRAGEVQTGEELHLLPAQGEKVPVVEIFRDHYNQAADEATLHRFLQAPLALRARQDLEKRLAKMAAKRE